jgi:hypothetical protein
VLLPILDANLDSLRKPAISDFCGVATFLATELAVTVLVPVYGFFWWAPPLPPANFLKSVISTKSFFNLTGTTYFLFSTKND